MVSSRLVVVVVVVQRAAANAASQLLADKLVRVALGSQVSARQEQQQRQQSGQTEANPARASSVGLGRIDCRLLVSSRLLTAKRPAPALMVEFKSLARLDLAAPFRAL